MWGGTFVIMVSKPNLQEELPKMCSSVCVCVCVHARTCGCLCLHEHMHACARGLSYVSAGVMLEQRSGVS